MVRLHQTPKPWYAAQMSPPRDSSAAAVLPKIDEEDPIERACRLAPIRYDEQITDEEREAMAEAAASGQWIPHAEVVAELEKRRPR